jgi:hypothetical protein
LQGGKILCEVFFFGWVSDFDGKVQILAPVIVKEQYRQVIAQADKK